MHAVYAVGVPWLREFYWAEEHLVHAEGVGTELIDNHVGVDDVEHGLGHLLDRPSTYVFAIFEDELGGGEVGTPCFEGLGVEYVGRDDVDVDVDWGDVVLVLKAVGYEGVGVLDSVDEVATALNHALVDELLEWLFGGGYAYVEEEFVPEAGVDEVSCGMLCAADVEVDVLPVVVGFGRDEGVVVVRVHVAQVVGAGACEAWHGA